MPPSGRSVFPNLRLRRRPERSLHATGGKVAAPWQHHALFLGRLLSRFAEDARALSLACRVHPGVIRLPVDRALARTVPSVPFPS